MCMGHAVDKDLLTLVQQNVNDQFASVQKQVAFLEDLQLCWGARLDEHEEVFMQQQAELQEMKEILKRLLHCQRAVSEQLSMQVHALQEGFARTDNELEELTARTDKVEHEVEELKQGLHATAVTGSLKMKNAKRG